MMMSYQRTSPPRGPLIRLFLLGLFLSAATIVIDHPIIPVVSALQVHHHPLSPPRTTATTRARNRFYSRRSGSLLLASANDNDDTTNEHPSHDDSSLSSSTGRRGFLATTSAALLTGLSVNVQPAHAGLMQFPCIRPLKNRYHFMRAGPSELEVNGVYSTNSLFITNRDNALADTPAARRIVLDACEVIKASPNFPTVAYHSLAANGMDTADMMATELRISRDRLLPEFTYLDQRGIGLWDSGAMDTVKPAIVALDYLEAGKEGQGGRPPANEDGTANEALGDQFVRLRQFLSLQESRTSGENILIIFPDGTGPALLSAMIAGIPLNECHCLDYAPGEVRLEINRDTVLEQYAQRKDDPKYLAMIEDGKVQLAKLRQGQVANVKEELQEEQRREIDNAFAEQRKAQREKEQISEAKREQEKLERDAKEQMRRQEEKTKTLAREQAARERKEQAEAAERAKREQMAAAAAAKQEAAAAAYAAKKSGAVADSSGDSDNGGLVLGAAGIVGLAGAAFVAIGGGDDTAAVPAPKDPEPSPSSSASAVAEEAVAEIVVNNNNATTTLTPEQQEVDVVDEVEAIAELDE
ncbi:Pfam:PGAM (Partial), partial [Seminavis robusta]|eukprot:Sro1782_g297200.1 Pfam:PGAM (582) ;mRNA; f:21007-22753